MGTFVADTGYWSIDNATLARIVYERVIEDTFARHLNENDLKALSHITRKLISRVESLEPCQWPVSSAP